MKAIAMTFLVLLTSFIVNGQSKIEEVIFENGVYIICHISLTENGIENDLILFGSNDFNTDEPDDLFIISKNSKYETIKFMDKLIEAIDFLQDGQKISIVDGTSYSVIVENGEKVLAFNKDDHLTIFTLVNLNKLRKAVIDYKGL